MDERFLIFGRERCKLFREADQKLVVGEILRTLCVQGHDGLYLESAIRKSKSQPWFACVT